MSESRNELNLTWVTAPPIVKIERYEIKARIERLKTNMADWKPVAVPSSLDKSDIDTSDWKSPQRTQQERWNIRVASTNQMLNAVTLFAACDDVVQYEVAGEPVGIMGVNYRTGKPLYVEALVCHPGSAEAGGILIEYAVNLAAKEHGQPVVKLSASDEEARQAYLKLGFRSASATRPMAMELDAGGTEVWKNTSDGWRLAKYAVRGTFAA